MLNFKEIEKSIDNIIESDYYKKLKFKYMSNYVEDLDIKHICDYYLLVPESKISELNFNEYIKPKWVIFDKYVNELTIIKVPQN